MEQGEHIRKEGAKKAAGHSKKVLYLNEIRAEKKKNKKS